MSMRASILVAVLAGLVACGSNHPASTADGGGTGGATGGAGGGTGGGAAGASGMAGAGGTGGGPAGCDVDVARQALATLGITTVGELRTSTTMVSATLTDAQWSV